MLDRLTEENRIKLTLLCLMREATRAFTKSELSSAAQRCSPSVYIEIDSLVGELISEGNAELSADGYVPTVRGKTIADNLSYLLTPELKNSIFEYTLRGNSASETVDFNCSVDNSDAASSVTLSVNSGKQSSLTLSVSNIDADMANTILRVCENDPGGVYRRLMTVLTGMRG